VVSDVEDYDLTADGKKLLVIKGRTAAIIDLKEGGKLDKKLRTAEMEATVDPRAEWKQVFTDAWRLERDYFYDPAMHGVDWAKIRTRYGALLDQAVTRWDVNFVIGEMIAELNASHTYRGGGAVETPKNVNVGYLGVDWAVDNGGYRIKRIVRGAPWDVEARSPLDVPGVGVKEGEYVLAVNGVPMDPKRDPYAAFQGTGGEPVELLVNGSPDAEGARRVIVQTLASESRLRYLEWVERSRQRVDAASGGTIGYVYVPNTGTDGQSELVRQFAAQFHKQGLIIDERFNSGGQIPDRFIELLNRPPLAFWAIREGQSWQWPPVAHFGHKAMLINGWSGSGGDAFPDYFRKAGLGPLIGERTWGGLIGISGAPALIDGGNVTVPTFRMYNPDGTWFKEGHGVDPDIEVTDDPSAMAVGKDPQLDRAVDEVLSRIRQKPPVLPAHPPYEKR
jgi:tricorn protease